MEAGMACGLSHVTPEHTGHLTASDELIFFNWRLSMTVIMQYFKYTM